MGRFVQRTWRRTSEKICLANDMPPGFRIVLLDQDRRAKRDDLLVRSGGPCGFVWHSPSLPVSRFLENTIHDHVKDAEHLDYDVAELRDHKDEPVDPNFRLRRVRNMPGAGGQYCIASLEDTDLQMDIESALEVFDEDPRSGPDSGADFLLRALVAYARDRWGTGAIDDELEGYRAIEKARSERRA